MKKRIDIIIVLLFSLVCLVLLFGCDKTSDSNIGNNIASTDPQETDLGATDAPAEHPLPPADISEYSKTLYVSGADKDISEVITTKKELTDFLDNSDIKTNISVSPVNKNLGKLREEYGDRFFLEKNLIICISKRKDIFLYGDIYSFYGNKEQIEILFEDVQNKDMYSEVTKGEGLSSCVVFEVPKSVCTSNTEITFMLREKKLDPLTSPSQWIKDNLDRRYHNSGEKYFPDDLYNISILGFLCDTEKIDSYLNNVFWKEYDGLTPPLYMLIKALDVDKGEFWDMHTRLLNYNSKYGHTYPVEDLRHLHALFEEDENTARNNLCKYNYVYSDGQFYDFLESDVIVYNNLKHTFKDWCLLFFEDMELYDEFLCYADAKAYARFRHDMSAPNALSHFLEKDQDGNAVFDADISRSFTVLQYKLDSQYGNILIPAGTNQGDLIRYYSSELIDNGFPSVFFRIKEVREHYNTNYMHKTNAAELDHMPTAYYIIRDMGLKNRIEEFRGENEYRITTTEEITRYFIDPRELELLFGSSDKETLKKELKRPTVFYFDGRLYDLEDLKNADSDLLDKLGRSDGFKDYLTNLTNMRVFKNSDEEYVSAVYDWLEQYYGIKKP